MQKYSYSARVGDRDITVETGTLARLAGGAVSVRSGDSVVLAAATAARPREGVDFFPLSVDFEERLYAAGRIPGSFQRREGRPKEYWKSSLQRWRRRCRACPDGLQGREPKL